MFQRRRLPLTVWNPWAQMQHVQDEMQSFLATDEGEREFPEVSLWTGERGTRLSAYVPGFDASNLDVSVVGDTVTVRAIRAPLELEKGQAWHRRERATGKFVRTFQLPHEVDADRVQAIYKNGVLEVELPRSARETPRRIAVTAP